MIKRVVIVLLIVLTSFTVFALYRTLAYDTSVVENTPSTTDLDYTFQIGNSSIKQLVVEPNETRYYDVVMYNPNPAKISYGIYYEMVSPTTKPDDYSIVYKKRSRDKSSGVVSKESSIQLSIEVVNNTSETVTVKLGSVAGYVKGGELTLEDGQVLIPEKQITASEFVELLDDGGNGDSGSGVYKIHHDEISSTDSVTGEVIPAVDDYRYYGANPDNYVCLDFEGNKTCPDKHLYRIIGSIYDELESTNRLKIIKATVLTDGTVNTFAWDYKSDGTTENIWATPTETRNNITNNYSNSTTSGSSLMVMLNSGIWWSDTTNTGKMYDGSNESGRDVNFANYKLSSNAKSIIGDSRYYLAGHNIFEITSGAMYIYERTTTGYKNGRINNSRPYYWEGKVALMYPSDYGYAAGTTCATGTHIYKYDTSCKNIDWLLDTSNWQWLLPMRPSDPEATYSITSSGSVNYIDMSSLIYYTTAKAFSVRPVFYLKPQVIFTSGLGTIDNPYIPSMP